MAAAIKTRHIRYLLAVKAAQMETTVPMQSRKVDPAFLAAPMQMIKFGHTIKASLTFFML